MFSFINSGKKTTHTHKHTRIHAILTKNSKKKHQTVKNFLIENQTEFENLYLRIFLHILHKTEIIIVVVKKKLHTEIHWLYIVVI